MVLVDSSVWIDHLRCANRKLEKLLLDGEVACHPFVIGELACGNMKGRAEVLDLLESLPSLPKAEDEEVLFFIERHSLMRRGLGLIDVHLLVSATIAETFLWTLDLRLKTVAEALELSFG